MNRVPLVQPQLLTQKELERRLGVSDMAIDNWRKHQKYSHDPFPTDKTPTKGGYHRLRYDWVQVLYWLERNMPQRFLALNEKDRVLIQGLQTVERKPDIRLGQVDEDRAQEYGAQVLNGDLEINTNRIAMELMAKIAALQNGNEKNSDPACWFVWNVIKAAFAKLAATIPGCETRFDSAPSALTPERLAAIAAKYPKILYFTHGDSAAKVLNVNNRSVVCKVIAPESERGAFAKQAAEIMRRDFGLTVGIASDYSTLSVLTYYPPSIVAAALQDTAPAPAMVSQQDDLIAPATARSGRQAEAEPTLEQEASASSAPVRIQLDFQAEYVKELDELMKETKIVTRKDLFNNALTLFQWAAKAKRAGRIVASLDEKTGTARELVMPALENISAR